MRELSEADGEEADFADIERGLRRYLRLLVEVPGHGAREAVVEYAESYERAGSIWKLSAYQYELRFEPATAGRWAEHWHDAIFHRHCEHPTARRHAHYAGQPIDAYAAREELLRLYAGGAASLPCRGLRPLA